jgi:hypothetical protein
VRGRSGSYDAGDVEGLLLHLLLHVGALELDLVPHRRRGPRARGARRLAVLGGGPQRRRLRSASRGLAPSVVRHSRGGEADGAEHPLVLFLSSLF